MSPLKYQKKFVDDELYKNIKFYLANNKVFNSTRDKLLNDPQLEKKIN